MAALENILQRAYRNCQQHNAPPVDIAGFSFCGKPRAAHKLQCHNRGRNSQRYINIKYKRPAVVIYDIASERRAQRWADNHTQPVDCLGHTSFFQRIGFGNDRLRRHQQSAATDTLHQPEKDKFPDIGRVTAQERKNSKYDNGSREIITSPELLRQPAGHRYDDNISDGIRGDNPPDFRQGSA